MPENEWINLLLMAAKDFQILIALLFFLGIVLIIISIVDVSKYGVKAENKKMAFMSGIAIAVFAGLMIAVIFTNSMGINVSGTVANPDGSPVRNVVVSIGNHEARTNGNGYYSIPEVPRNESQVNVIIRGNTYPETVEMPDLYWNVRKDIIILPINLSIEGEVYDEDGSPVSGASVNLSWENDISTITDSYGKFDFGYQQVPFVLTKPLRLFVRLSPEVKPRNIVVLKIPSEEPYEIYYPVKLMPKDWVNVTGTVILKENNSTGEGIAYPRAVIYMGDKIARSGESGSYFLSKVPINTERYILKTSEGQILANHTIFPLLREGVDIPRTVDLFIYKSELNGTVQ